MKEISHDLYQLTENFFYEIQYCFIVKSLNNPVSQKEIPK